MFAHGRAGTFGAAGELVRSIGLLVIGGCAYQAGSFDAWGHAFRGVRATAGCLDLALEWRADHPRDAVLDYDFGNRCDRPVIVDLLAPSVFGRTDRGDVTLVPYDPLHEIEALPLDGRSLGNEAIAYRGADPAELSAICVDGGAIAAGAGSLWLCVGRPTSLVAGGSR